MTTRSARAQVEVEVDPATAFKAFTEDIGRWWVPGPINNWDFGKALGKKIEEGVGGRVLEVYAETEVDVTFEEIENGTRISVEHSVLPGADVRPGALFFPNILHWLVPWCRNYDANRPERKLARTAISLHYRDPARAARWLADTFGLTTWAKLPEEGDQWIELNFEGTSIILFPGDGEPGKDHQVWLFVDDLDAHHEKVSRRATIVEPIKHHGFTAYTAEDEEGHRWTFVQASPAMIEERDPWRQM